LIALFTAGLFWATWYLYRATKRLVGGAEDTAQRQLRAYVLVEGVHVKNAVSGEGQMLAQVTIKNFGQTPASEIVTVTGFAFGGWPLSRDLTLTIPESEFTKPNRSRSVLGPTQTEHATTLVRAPTSDERQALITGQLAIVIYGEIRYLDAFKRQQTTKYRFMMGGPVGTTTAGHLAACEEGNEAT